MHGGGNGLHGSSAGANFANEFNNRSINRFKIGNELGAGSFSTIYEAFDLKKNKKVAIKMEKPDKAK